MLIGEFLVLLVGLFALFFLLAIFIPRWLLNFGRSLLQHNTRFSRWYLNREYNKAWKATNHFTRF